MRFIVCVCSNQGLCCKEKADLLEWLQKQTKEALS